MAFEAPLDPGYNPDGFNGPAKGRYHVMLVKCDEDGGEKGEMICDFEVLAGTTQNQDGLKHREYFQKTIKAMGRIHSLAIALGMITADELKAMQARGQSPNYDFESKADKSNGAQLCIGLEEEEYNGKVRVKANFNLFHLTNPKVADWPKNAGMLAKAGISIPAKSASGSGQSSAPAASGAGINLAGIV